MRRCGRDGIRREHGVRRRHGVVFHDLLKVGEGHV